MMHRRNKKIIPCYGIPYRSIFIHDHFCRFRDHFYSFCDHFYRFRDHFCRFRDHFYRFRYLLSVPSVTTFRPFRDHFCHFRDHFLSLPRSLLPLPRSLLPILELLLSNSLFNLQFVRHLHISTPLTLLRWKSIFSKNFTAKFLNRKFWRFKF